MSEKDPSKNLDYYTEHPDELPDDVSIEALAELSDGKSAPDDNPEPGQPAPRADTPPADQPPQPGPDAPSPSADKDDPSKLEDPNAVVIGRDGKSHIPYSVLKGTRDELTQTRGQLTEAQSKLEQATTELQALKAAPQPSAPAGGKPGEGKDAPPPAADALPRTESGTVDWAKLESEYPEDVVRAIRAAHDSVAGFTETVKQLEGKIQELSQERAQRVQSEQEQAGEAVQDTIDSIPILAHWQSSDPAMWEKACELDQHIKNTKAFAEYSLEDRFKEVVKMLGFDPSKPLQASKEELERAAQERLRQAGSHVPRSHTDLPGGKQPAQSETERLASLDPKQLEAEFEKLTPEQQDAYLAGI